MHAHVLKFSALSLLRMSSGGSGPSPDRRDSDLCAAFARLRVRGDNNHIQINISTGSGSSPSSSRGPLGRDGASGASAAKAKAGPQGRALHQDLRRYYVIFKCSRNPSVCGLWHCTWAFLACRLPGGKLWGSTASPCKGFDSEALALAYWEAHIPEGAPARQEQAWP